MLAGFTDSICHPLAPANKLSENKLAHLLNSDAGTTRGKKYFNYNFYFHVKIQMSFSNTLASSYSLNHSLYILVTHQLHANYTPATRQLYANYTPAI